MKSAPINKESALINGESVPPLEQKKRIRNADIKRAEERRKKREEKYAAKGRELGDWE